MSPELIRQVRFMASNFEVDGDLCDYAYLANELFEAIVKEIDNE